MSAPTLTAWTAEWKDVLVSINELNGMVSKFVELSEDRAQQQTAVASANAGIAKAIRGLQDDLTRARRAGTITEAEAADCLAEMQRHRAAVQELQKEFMPRQASRLLALLLGDVNVTLPVMSDRFKYKTEYEDFKLMVTYIIIVLSTLCLAFHRAGHNARLLESVFHFLLVCYYGTLIVREHILIANGSRIRKWWRYHHYLAIVLSAIVLIWPEGAAYTSFHTQFMLFSWYLGLVQLLQYRYQKSQLYARRALGTATAMETITDLPVHGSFHGVIGVLVLAYTFQLYNAYTLFQMWDAPEWQVQASAVLFLILGLGNILTTFRVVRAKGRQKPEQPAAAAKPATDRASGSKFKST